MKIIYISHLDPVHGELPITVSCDRNVSEVPRVILGVRSSQQQLSAHLSGWVPVEVETEHGGLDKALADHVVKGRHHLVDSNVGVAHAQDPVKLGGHKGHAWLREGLSKCLVLDVHTTEGDSVSRQEAGQAARSIPDLKLCPIGLNIALQLNASCLMDSNGHLVGG